MSKNILIAFYSKSGNTRQLANMVHAEVGGRLLDIEAEAGEAFDLAPYDTVFVGTPNWAGTLTPPVQAFLADHDLTGKVVVPFCTHGMGGLQNVAADIEKHCADATVLPSFAIKGVEVESAPEKVKAWLLAVGLL